MAEFVHHHIVLDHKIPSKITANTIKKNIAKDGNCCSPRTSLQLIALSILVFVIQALLMMNTSGLIPYIMLASMVPTVAFGAYNSYRVRDANRYMYSGSPVIICLGSGSSTATSAAPWSESPGLSSPWGEFIEGCRRYENLLEKVPENDLVSDELFFSTVEDIYALFEHTYLTGQTISKHRMETEFATIRTAIVQFEEFIEKSSQIYASLRFTANGERLKSIDNNLAHMNSVAQSKISSLMELENPNSKARAVPVEPKKKKVHNQYGSVV